MASTLFFVKSIHFLEKEVYTPPASSILPGDAWARAGVYFCVLSSPYFLPSFLLLFIVLNPPSVLSHA